MIYFPKNKQTVLDVILQHHGKLDEMFDVLKENNFDSINPDMTQGVTISPIEKSRVVQYYRQNQIEPSNQTT